MSDDASVLSLLTRKRSSADEADDDEFSDTPAEKRCRSALPDQEHEPHYAAAAALVQHAFHLPSDAGDKSRCTDDDPATTTTTTTTTDDTDKPPPPAVILSSLFHHANALSSPRRPAAPRSPSPPVSPPTPADGDALHGLPKIASLLKYADLASQKQQRAEAEAKAQARNSTNATNNSNGKASVKQTRRAGATPITAASMSTSSPSLSQRSSSSQSAQRSSSSSSVLASTSLSSLSSAPGSPSSSSSASATTTSPPTLLYGSEGAVHHLKTPRGPSSKDSSRLFGVVWMLRGVLPPTRPPFVLERQWKSLTSDPAIVSIIRFEAGALTLRFPEEYDTVVHSRAIYGPTLTRFTEPIKTRFRWWSDCSVDQISPIKNLKISQTHVERKITLPKDITGHPFLRALYKNPAEHSRLLWELSDFFEDLLHAFLHPKDIDALDTSGFGRSRKRLLTTCDDSSRAFDETLAANIARWDRLLVSDEPPRSRREGVRFGFGERYPDAIDPPPTPSATPSRPAVPSSPSPPTLDDPPPSPRPQHRHVPSTAAHPSSVVFAAPLGDAVSASSHEASLSASSHETNLSVSSHETSLSASLLSALSAGHANQPSPTVYSGQQPACTSTPADVPAAFSPSSSSPSPPPSKEHHSLSVAAPDSLYASSAPSSPPKEQQNSPAATAKMPLFSEPANSSTHLTSTQSS